MDATSVNAFKGRLERRRRHVLTRWTFLKTGSLQVQLAARLLIYIYSDDLRTTKVGAAAPGELLVSRLQSSTAI